jgi:hypothetical protein
MIVPSGDAGLAALAQTGQALEALKDPYRNQRRGRHLERKPCVRQNFKLPPRGGKAIALQIAKAGGETITGLGLRFDRVVVRVLRDLWRCAERSTPARATVILTLTAPIRVPAKTVSALELEIDALLRAGVDARDRIADVWGNAARLRLVEPASTRSYKLIGFVHHRGIDAKHLLDLAERWLVEAT